jgi:CheY-like chemotaxis protein
MSLSICKIQFPARASRCRLTFVLVAGPGGREIAFVSFLLVPYFFCYFFENRKQYSINIPVPDKKIPDIVKLQRWNIFSREGTNMNNGKKILLVSQDNHFINTIGKNLNQYNFRVNGTRAKNEELIQVMNSLIPDLTILDTPLVSMDGVRQLIGIREAMDTPIMMLSTQGSRADTVRTLSIGSYSHPFIKPITFEELVNQIKKLLNNN